MFTTKERPRLSASSSSNATHDHVLRVASVRKQFAGQSVLNSVDLDISPGEFFTLLGPSGCGKTTLLRIISGLETADAGSVIIGDRDITREPPERRPFNMVFQSYALFPHMSVAENVGYGLRIKALPAAEARRRVREALELVDLPHLRDRAVAQLSGGQRQRIALARALVNEPEVLLLDEPLGALDLQLRKRLQEELRAIQQRVGTTFVYVTHDQEEALSLSDRIAVMQAGDLVQVASPMEIYNRPRTKFVAEFVGEANLIPGEVIRADHETATVRIDGGHSVELPAGEPGALAKGDRGLIVVRPENLEVAASSDAHLECEVVQSTFLGNHRIVRARLADGQLIRMSLPAHHDAPSGRLGLQIRQGAGVAVRAD